MRYISRPDQDPADMLLARPSRRPLVSTVGSILSPIGRRDPRLLIPPPLVNFKRPYSWQTYWKIPEKFRPAPQAAKKPVRTKKKRMPTPAPQSHTDIETNMILGRALNMSVSNNIRCTVLDEQGRVKVVDGEFKRGELLSKHGLLARDLRKVDKSSDNIVPSILVRENSILVCLLHVRALIKHDSVLLFETNGFPPESQSLFLYDLEHRLRKQSPLSYELRALESILMSVLASLESEWQLISKHVHTILEEIGRTIDREQLRDLLVSSKQLRAFHQKVELIRDALEELTDDDEYLAGIYLTAKAEGKPLTETDDHSSVEIMLESYYNHCDEIAQSASNLLANIKSTEDIINIVLDSNRNKLMLLELKFQIGMLGLGGGSLISAMYGMNLKNFIEDTWWGFGAVGSVVGLVSVCLVVFSLRRLHQVQRMTMGTRNIKKGQL